MSDNEDLYRLAADFEDVAADASDFVMKAVQVNAHNTRDTWREKSTGFAHLPAFPYSITYDVRGRDNQIEAEVGPDKSRAQGALGNLVEFGSVNNTGFGFGLAALQENEADLEQGITKALEDGRKRRGL